MQRRKEPHIGGGGLQRRMPVEEKEAFGGLGGLKRRKGSAGAGVGFLLLAAPPLSRVEQDILDVLDRVHLMFSFPSWLPRS
jgi:hypothetical protein